MLDRLVTLPFTFSALQLNSLRHVCVNVWQNKRKEKKKLNMNNNTYAKNRSNAKNFFSNAKITHTMAQRNKQIYGKTISSSCAETEKWFCNYLRTQQQLRLKKWQRVYVIAFFQPCVCAYIHTYVCLCVRVCVRLYVWRTRHKTECARNGHWKSSAKSKGW